MRYGHYSYPELAYLYIKLALVYAEASDVRSIIL